MTTHNNDLSRKIILHVTQNGIMTIGPVFGPEVIDRVSVSEWREIVTDLVLQGRLEEAKRTADSMKAEDGDGETLYSLPVFSVNTVQEAKTMQVIFCRMVKLTPSSLDDGITYGSDKHRPNNAYQVKDFTGDLESLERLQQRMSEFYNTRMVK